jgi:DnaK suppressor protein
MTRKKKFDKIRQVLAERQIALRKALRGDLSLLNELREQKVYDLVDAAFISVGNEINAQLAEVVSQELANIERAFDRMCEGEFGICEDCNSAISIERLNALPYTTRCIRCQQLAEIAFSHKNYLAQLVAVSGGEEPILDDI